MCSGRTDGIGEIVECLAGVKPNRAFYMHEDKLILYEMPGGILQMLPVELEDARLRVVKSRCSKNKDTLAEMLSLVLDGLYFPMYEWNLAVMMIKNRLMGDDVLVTAESEGVHISRVSVSGLTDGRMKITVIATNGSEKILDDTYCDVEAVIEAGRITIGEEEKHYNKTLQFVETR